MLQLRKNLLRRHPNFTFQLLITFIFYDPFMTSKFFLFFYFYGVKFYNVVVNILWFNLNYSSMYNIIFFML